ncbi:MAG: hypothetical protein IJY60_01695 [Bacteroides sp.]|nr:hypothetical protein [Bacteroides sp.]
MKKLVRFSVKKKKHESIWFRPHRRSVKKFVRLFVKKKKLFDHTYI